MPERTDQPTPMRPSRILAEPATVERCQADYAAAQAAREQRASLDHMGNPTAWACFTAED